MLANILLGDMFANILHLQAHELIHGKQNVKTTEGPLAKNSGRPNVLSNELLKKTKDIVIGTRQAGTVISRRMVIAIGTGVAKANESNLLRVRWPPGAYRRLGTTSPEINGVG